MKYILFLGGAFLVLSVAAYFFMSSETTQKPITAVDTKLNIEQIPKLLHGVTMHIPVGEVSLNVSIEPYISNGVTVLGGTADNEKGYVTAYIPSFTNILPKGAWGVIDAPYVYVPVYVGFGGSGQFFMVALFEYDATTQTLTHRDLHFVDDRIAFDGMVQSAPNIVTAMYRTHAEGEAMSDEPTLPTQRVIRAVNGSLQLIQ